MDSTDLKELKRQQRFNTGLDLIGKTLISSGVLLLLFVAYQLWGTGLAESQAQNKLKSQFITSTTVTSPATDAPTTTTLPPPPKKGDVVAQIIIEKINVDKFVIAGVGYKELEKGPGLFAGSPLPGQLGNVAIAGHRTTFGAPFGRVNELTKGDRIVMKTSRGEFVYLVTGAPTIVKATDVDVIRTVDPARAILTLVTCHPKWTSENRMIISAELEPKVIAQEATVFVADATEPEAVLTEGWFHDPSAWPMVILFAFLLIAIAGIARWWAGKKWRAVIVYPVAAVVFLPTLFVFFGYLTRLLPTNL
jgi:sortase A